MGSKSSFLGGRRNDGWKCPGSVWLERDGEPSVVKSGANTGARRGRVSLAVDRKASIAHRLERSSGTVKTTGANTLRMRFRPALSVGVRQSIDKMGETSTDPSHRRDTWPWATWDFGKRGQCYIWAVTPAQSDHVDFYGLKLWRKVREGWISVFQRFNGSGFTLL